MRTVHAFFGRHGMLRTSMTVLACALGPLVARPAIAADCSPPNHVSPCIDSDALWFAPPSSHWVSMAVAPPLPLGRVSTGLGLAWFWHPIVIDAPSPDPEGREIQVVEGALDATLGAAIGIGYGMSADVALPFTLVQLGAGVQGLSSQTAPAITATALRDPRLALTYARTFLLRRTRVLAQTRMEMAVPVGDRDALAGGRSVVAAPSAALQVEYGPLSLGSEVGLRSRMTSELAGARVGSELSVALGAAVTFGRERRFSVRVEAWMRPSLVPQDHVLPDGTQVDVSSVASEWIASVSAEPEFARGFTFGLGGGTAIPLSTERRTAVDGSSAESTFASITTPAYRLVAFVRFVSGSR